ncbi:MAG TPA: hypothetical protein DEB24_01920 [Coriobacteriia bacterium]|nr:hypothetical protein [Coriobacteriia bacterium]
MTRSVRNEKVRKSVKYLSVVFAVLVVAILFSIVFTEQAHAATAAEKQAEADAAGARLSESEQAKAKTEESLNAAVAGHDEAAAALNDAKQRESLAATNIKTSQELLDWYLARKKTDGEFAFLETVLGTSGFKTFNTDLKINEMTVEESAKAIEENKNALFKAGLARVANTLKERFAHDREEQAEAAKVKDDELVAQQKAEFESLKSEADELAKKEAKEKAVINAAISKLGVPYIWGATGPDSFDCSGLTSWSYLQAGRGWIGRTDADQYANASERFAYTSGGAQVGDILWWPGHVGIYAGDGQYINAPSSGDVVKYSNWRIESATVLRFP